MVNHLVAASRFIIRVLEKHINMKRPAIWWNGAFIARSREYLPYSVGTFLTVFGLIPEMVSAASLSSYSMKIKKSVQDENFDSHLDSIKVWGKMTITQQQGSPNRADCFVSLYEIFTKVTWGVFDNHCDLLTEPPMHGFSAVYGEGSVQGCSSLLSSNQSANRNKIYTLVHVASRWRSSNTPESMYAKRAEYVPSLRRLIAIT